MNRFEIDPKNEADVQQLLRIFPDILPDGRLITHEQIEAALSMSRLSAKYRSVVTKWRRVLQYERCIYLDGLSSKGRGFVSLTPDEMIRFGNRGVRAAGRKLRRALQVVSLPDDAALSEETRKYRGLLSLAMEKIIADHRSALRDVSRALAPIKQLPRASAGERP
jgi:hypothetical protein